jgi:N-acetylmuramoyl-L-alanine amidase
METSKDQFNIYIDFGHGEKLKNGISDPGAVSGKFIERDMNVIYGTTLAERLRQHGYNVKTEPGNLSITASAQTANSFGADFLISCHINAGGGDRGEVIYSIRQGSKKLADAVVEGLKRAGQTTVRTYTKMNDAGNADYYGILRIAKMPAVIIEPFFIDNAVDRQIGDTPEELKRIGVCIADAIATVYGSDLNRKGDDMLVRLNLSETVVDLPEVDVKVNGASIGKGVLLNISGSDITHMPVRAIAESLGAKVDWDANTRTVLITKGGR